MVLITSACFGERVAPMMVFDADFIERYAHTLNAMFDNEWTLLSVEEAYFEGHGGYICSCGFDGRPQQFLEWTIGYRDGNGGIRQFVFDNRSRLATQVERYVEQYIAAYFQENFFAVYLTNLPLAPSANVSVSMIRANTNRHLGENQEWIRAVDAYQNQLGRPEGAIRLSQLTPGGAFAMMPLRLRVNVSFAGEESLGRSFEEAVMGDIERMIASMNRFTDNQLTASVRVGYHQIVNLHTGSRSYSWYYIQGERMFGLNTMYFDRYMFEHFRGVFW